MSVRGSVPAGSSGRFGATDLHWSRPKDPCGTGVLVLAGSSGRLDTARADILASAGATALALRWFGGEGQPALPCGVPLETFTDALDLLAPEVDRLAILGLSYGAEAALLTAVRDSRLDAVIALAPSDVAWEGAALHDDDPPLGKWTWRGQPVPFVPVDRTWTPQDELPAFAPLYLRSRELVGPQTVDAATIPVEDITAELVLVAGGDDQVWPSSTMAGAIVARRADHGRSTELVIDPRAGHPVLLPGEAADTVTRSYRVGGDDDAPRRLGALAWPAIRDALRLP